MSGAEIYGLCFGTKHVSRRALLGLRIGICQKKPWPKALASHHRCSGHLPQALASHHRGICQVKNLTTSAREPSPRHLPTKRPYHQHSRAITAAFAKTQPYHKHSRAITAAVPRQKPYQKHSRAITTAFAKTKTLPQALASHHRVICQDKNLTESTREPLTRHVPRLKAYQKHPRAITAAFAKTKTSPPAPASHHHSMPRQKPHHKHSRAITAALPRQKPYQKRPRAITRQLQRQNPDHKHRRAITAACVKIPSALASRV